MLLGELKRLLEKKSKGKVSIYIGDNPDTPAGLTYNGRPVGYGITKRINLPERTVVENNHIVARGWKDVLKFCKNKGWIKDVSV